MIVDRALRRRCSDVALAAHCRAARSGAVRRRRRATSRRGCRPCDAPVPRRRSACRAARAIASAHARSAAARGRGAEIRHAASTRSQRTRGLPRLRDVPAALGCSPELRSLGTSPRYALHLVRARESASRRPARRRTRSPSRARRRAAVRSRCTRAWSVASAARRGPRPAICALSGAQHRDAAARARRCTSPAARWSRERRWPPCARRRRSRSRSPSRRTSALITATVPRPRAHQRIAHRELARARGAARRSIGAPGGRRRAARLAQRARVALVRLHAPRRASRTSARTSGRRR